MGARKSNTSAASKKKPAGSVYARVPGGQAKPDKTDTQGLRILPQKQEAGGKAAFYGRSAQAPAYSRSKQEPLQGNTGTTAKKKISYTRPKETTAKTGKAEASTAKKTGTGRSSLTLAPGYIILWSFILGICGYAYITHVFTTQRMLLDLNDARQELERTQIIHQDHVLEVERMSGPAEVLRRARDMGLENYGPPEFVIESRAEQKGRE